jgi:hypothetical protein
VQEDILLAGFHLARDHWRGAGARSWLDTPTNEFMGFSVVDLSRRAT